MTKVKMITVFSLICLLLALLLLSGQPVLAGGWATLTLEDLPLEIVAGRPFTVNFTVRQHGLDKMSGLSPRITAEHAETGTHLLVEAAETGQKGLYEASLTLPEPGEWHWTINAFNTSLTLPPLNVIPASFEEASPAVSQAWILGLVALAVAAGLAIAWVRGRRRVWLVGMAAALLLCLAAFGWQWQRPQVLVAEQQASSAIAPDQMGEALFVAKGCILCHQNHNVTMAANLRTVGPDLTNYEANAPFLRLWLADPPALKPQTFMPNLELSESEIETLITFLSTGAQ